MIFQQSLKIKTLGREMIDCTAKVSDLVVQSKIKTGICNLFLHHTSASLIFCENADPTVQSDLEAFMKKFVPDGDSLFKHTMEGPDDMPAHVRTVLTQNSLIIPVTQQQLNLGTWQGIYLWEHRLKGHERKLTVSILGDNSR